MPRTVITGGAGFIGSHLCERLLEEGHQVICIDNLLTGSVSNIAHLFPDPLFEFMDYDATHFLYVDGPVDYVLHFASPASPNDYLQFPLETLRVGAIGTLRGLGLARAKGARFLLASTSEVYGDPLIHPQPEAYWGNVNPVGPRGVYDEAKRYAEALTMAYRRTRGVDTTIARIFNTFGPRMRKDDGRAVPTFITQALEGEDITVFGNGLQTRSFGYISDLVEGIVRLLCSRVGEPVNLGNPEEISVLKMAQIIIELTGSRSKITYKDLPVDDPQVRQPDISKAARLLGWQPRVSAREGIAATITWFQESLEYEQLPAHSARRLA